jgi:hypothetical protein
MGKEGEQQKEPNMQGSAFSASFRVHEALASALQAADGLTDRLPDRFRVARLYKPTYRSLVIMQGVDR